MWDVRVTSNARRDRDRVVAWFDEHRPDASEAFLGDYFRTLRRIEANAIVPAANEQGFRRVRFDTFTYHVWYRVIEDSNVVFVVLLTHQGRDPVMIADRLRGS